MSDLVPDGFYGVYYTGADGTGAFGLLLHEGRIFGVDGQGADVTGTYVRNDQGVAVSAIFNFLAGAPLVNGTTLSEDLSVPFQIQITPKTLAGETISADLGIVRVNAAVRLKRAL